MSTNILTMFNGNDQIVGGATVAGSGPCANADHCFGYQGEYEVKQYDIASMKDMPIYLWGGIIDPFIPYRDTQFTEQFYKDAGADVTAVYEEWGHVWSNNLATSTDNPDKDCTSADVLGVHKCGYDVAGHMLNKLYGFTIGEYDTDYLKEDSKLYVLDTSKYTDSYLYDHAFLYVPNFCKTNECPIQIHFHGCSFTSKL